MPDDRSPDALTAEAPRQISTPTRRRTQARRRQLRYILFALGALVLVIGGLWWWLSGGRYVTTDDAYVETDVLDVSTDVGGLVEQVMVHEGERVAPNQVLFQLDGEKFRLAVDQARANLEQVALQIASLQADYAASEAQVNAQQAKVSNDQLSFNRVAALVPHGAATQQEYDNTRFALAGDEAALKNAQAQGAAALARLGGNPTMPVEQMPQYKQAAAQLGEAQRQLDHSVVRAPYAGMVTRVSKLQPGQFVAPGTAAFGLVATDHVWVTGQPKETSLTFARTGQTATVTVDAYPGHAWHGVVESVAPATDQQFSVLPAQNSSGNWVKVVQRVPVRVRINQQPSDPLLTAGMSAEISIDTGHKRALADLF
jgi:membrane fusion protein (multidrug efflux system)